MKKLKFNEEIVVDDTCENGEYYVYSHFDMSTDKPCRKEDGDTAVCTKYDANDNYIMNFRVLKKGAKLRVPCPPWAR